MNIEQALAEALIAQQKLLRHHILAADLLATPSMQVIVRVYEAAVALYRVSVADDTDTLPMEWDRLHDAIAAALGDDR